MIVIMNHGAGGREDPEARIVELLRSHDWEPHVLHPDQTRDIAALAREAARTTEPVIVAAGGDGTISTVAAALVGSDKILGVLPVGTLNHFAKDLHLPLDLENAVRTIAEGDTAAVDVAEVNGRVFINNSSLGLYPHIVSRREAQQQRLSRGKWTAFFWATIQALRRFPFLDLRIAFEGREIFFRRSAFLFVGNNQYETAGFNLGSRACVDAGNLGLYLTHRTGRLGLFRLAFHALFGRVDQAKDFDAFCVTEARIETRKRRLLVACDGEVELMETPLLYRSRPAALRVRVPRKGAG
ncbi:MAG TPA: diacylglycerol kinase family protein [Chthoniobacterales bacterium]|jgi:diacylglycerol kinase family enzyme|nr:diacylglycerol kinase family protein [Chthoniobacterales bacterium]